MEIEYHKDCQKDFQQGEYLWRYVNIHKFLHFIFSRSLYFTRMDLFNDPLEGITFKTWLENDIIQKTEISNPLIQKEIKEQFVEKNNNQLKKNIEDLIGRQKTQYVSCWFRGKRESFAMWNLYSNSNSVAIKINPESLFSKIHSISSLIILPDNFYNLLIGSVEYKDFKNIDPFSDNSNSKVIYPALRKDESFIHENEFRFILQSSVLKDEIKGVEFALGDISSLKIEIVCHPEMEKYQRLNLEEILTSKGMNGLLKESELKIKWFETYKKQIQNGS